ncbi:proteasome inhibitor PI31 subunit-like [Amblyomma americanum]
MECCDSGSEIIGVRDASPTASQESLLHMPRTRVGIEWPQTPQYVPLGQRDLNPFFGGGLGGGMIMDQRHLPRPPRPDLRATAPGLPRGAVPPGARFDPFGPPHPDHPADFRFAGPNPDHLARPPDDDDMFS